MKSSVWFVYIIRNEKGHLYTGITTDIDRRFKEHAFSKKGAKYFRGSGPSEVVFKKILPDRSSALKLEAMIKGLTRKKKLELVGKA